MTLPIFQNPSFRKILASIIAIAVVVLAYYGSYLPIKKSRAYIDVLQISQPPSAFEDFAATFQEPLDIPSPIGREELLRNFTNIVAGRISEGPADAEFVGKYVNLVYTAYEPILERGKGMSYTQNLYLLGTLYGIAAFKTQDGRYLENARAFFEEGLKRSPARPQFLYGLFDVYRASGNVEGVGRVARTILDAWP